MSNIQGSCFCGAIELTLPKDLPVAICHCIDCRKTSGSVASYNFMADPETFSVKGEPKYIDGKGDSGGATKRFFCGDCGSSLYTEISAPQPVFVKIGLFKPEDLTQKPVAEIFCKNLESWNKTLEGVQTKDGQ